MGVSRTGNGWAQRLIVEPGDRISVEGRYVQFPDGDWLDIAQINDLVLRPAPWKSHRSLRLEGIDASSIPQAWDPDQPFLPGRVRVVGTWREDAIHVDEQFPVRPSARTPYSPFTPPPPARGWNTGEQSRNVDGLDELRATGAIVRDQWIRHPSSALLLRVAAGDVEAVERVLGPQLPRRLYVVRSRYTAAHVNEVRDMFHAHCADWGFELFSSEGMTDDCQPYAEARLTRVRPDLADWADGLPDGLLTLRPAMTPA